MDGQYIHTLYGMCRKTLYISNEPMQCCALPVYAIDYNFDACMCMCMCVGERATAV